MKRNHLAVRQHGLVGTEEKLREHGWLKATPFPKIPCRRGPGILLRDVPGAEILMCVQSAIHSSTEEGGKPNGGMLTELN